MTAIYTYHATQGNESCGFLNQNDMAMFLTLSVKYSKKHFGKAKLITNNYGKEILIDKFKVPFTEVSTELEGVTIPEGLWAYSKLHSYSLQKESFIHIDIDCVLWQKPSAKQLKATMLFQHKELFTTEQGYYDLLNAINPTTVSFFCRQANISKAYNCGIVGANDLDMVKKWKSLVDEFIFNPANAKFWESQSNKSQFNYLFEQYFIACLTDDVQFLIGENENTYKPKFKMTHLWGKTKQSPMMQKVKDRFKKEYPKDFARIDKIDRNEFQVFDSLFAKGNDKYKLLFHKTVKDKKVKSIVYLGFDKECSRYVNLDGTITDFLYHNATKNIMPQCDLLIIKDMMLIWDGNQYAQFVSSPIPAKWILDAKGVFQNRVSG
jgi:hypothetical protein